MEEKRDLSAPAGTQGPAQASQAEKPAGEEPAPAEKKAAAEAALREKK